MLERLEDRALLSTFHVALTGDDGTGNGSIVAPYRTVQAAINAAGAASDGADEIDVASGTYNGTDVDGKWSIPDSANITSLVISGGWDATFTTRTPQSTIYIPSTAAEDPPTGASGDIDIVDAGTTIDGFYFVFDGNGVGGAGGTRISGGLVVQNTDITINNNTIEIGSKILSGGARSTGIQTASSDTSNLTISNNSLRADGSSVFAGLSQGIFLNPGVGTNTQITGNTFTGTSYAGIITLKERGDVTISDNVIQRSGPATGFQAIDVRISNSATPIANLVITGNTIDGGGTGTGIHLGDGSGIQAITGFVVENNILSNHIGSSGILIGGGASQANAISGTIAFNSITGNTNGMTLSPLTTGSNAIDASRNWWGAVSGPSLAANPGGLGDPITGASSIPFAPWLIYAPDTNPALPGVQLPTTVTVTPGGDVSAADNDFTRLQNAIGAAATGQIIDIQGTFNWTTGNAATAYLASTASTASADIHGVEIAGGVANLTITSSDQSGEIIGQGDVSGDSTFESFVFTDTETNANLVIENLTITDFESAVMLGWNGFGPFTGTRIRNNIVEVAGDNGDVNDLQNIAFYFSAGTDQQLTGNTVTFQADGTRAVGSGARSFGFQNSTTGGTGYDGLVISGNTFQLGATANGEVITGIWENGHNDDNSSDISISNNQFLGLTGIRDFDRGLMLTSQSTGLIVDGNIFTDVDNVFFARNAAGGTEVGDKFTITNSTLTRVGGADGIFLQNVTNDAIPTHVVINWNINNTVDGFTGVRGLNELSVAAAADSRPLTGATDLDSVNAVGALPSVFVDDSFAGAARFTDPDGIGTGFGPAAFEFNAFSTIADGLAAVNAGGTVNVGPGTYAENLLVDKPVHLVGPNAAIDPNTGVRVGEAILLPAVTETSVQGSTSGVIVRVGSSGGHIDVTIAGFTIDGHNAALTGGRMLNGVEVHTGAGIANSISSFDTNPGGRDVTLDVQNNIIQNLERYGVLIDNVAARTPSTGNNVSHNKIDNLPSGNNFGGGRGRAAAFEENVYGTFSYNVVTRVNVGWQDDNYDLASPGAGTLVDHNTISTYHRGIFHNLQYGNATAATISNNTISVETSGDFPATSTNFGIEISSILGGGGVSVTNNNVTGNVYGILLWGITSGTPVTVSGGTLTGNQYGVFATSNDPQFGGASETEATTTGVTVVNPTVAGIAIDDSSNLGHVALSFGSGNSVSGGPVGLLVDGSGTEILGNTLNNLALAGQTGNYITLANGALDDQTINATNVSFDGLLPSAMSAAQLAALENKIYHEVDDATLGLIETTPGVFYVTPASPPTAADNDYTRLAKIMDIVAAGDTVVLSGTFDWTEANASASWALGNDGLAGTFDDYSLYAPADVNDVTWTSDSLGAATIQGPGDLAAVNLEGVFVFDGGDNQGWTISNLQILDFDLSIGLFFGAGGSDAFDNTTITNNLIRIPADLNTTVAPADVNQNIGIHFAFGTNQTISNNTIEIVGSGASDGGNFSSSVGMQSNTSGGDIYDGLLIDNNTINVTGALAAEPSTVLGIWENSAGHLSNITVSNNDFNNLTGSNAATNLMRAFRVTSHSSATTTVSYSGNTVSGASIGFQWLAGSDFTGNQPVQLTGNIVTNTQTGVLVQSNGLVNLTGNTFDGVSGTSIGVDIVAGSTATLFRNDISGANIGVNNSGTLTSVTENFIRNNTGDGLRVNVSGTVTGVISNNDLSGNGGFAINNLSSILLDASGNAYGTSSFSGVAGVLNGDIDYSPWRDSTVDTDTGTAGFQGDSSSLGVDDNSPQATAVGYINEALSALGDGLLVGGARTIHVAPGSYGEVVNLGVPLRLVLDGDVSIDSLDSTVGTTVNLQANTLTVGGSSANNTLAGTVQGAGGNLTKVGSGRLILSNANSYTGTTTVDAGTLLVNGSTTSNTTVNSTATLGGNGTINGSVAIVNGGTLTPGNSSGAPTTGIFSTGNLSLASGATLTVDVNGRVAGSQSDEVAVTGTVNIAGATLSPTGTVTSFPGQVITLISNDDSDAVTGTFASQPEGSTVIINGVTFVLSYHGGLGGNDVTLTEAPAVATIDDVTVNEGDGTATFTLVLDKPLDIDVTITVTFTDVSATGGGTDYTSTTQQIMFLAGQTSRPVVVPINDDNLVEGTETFTVSLSTSTELGGRSLILSDTATGTITDNDSATVSIATDSNGAESDTPTNGHFTVTLTKPSSTDTVVTYSVTGSATPDSDYTALTGTVTIPAGQTTADIAVAVLNDDLVEDDETVTVTITGFGTHDPDITQGSPLTQSDTVTIMDDDVLAITSTIDSVNVPENTPTSSVLIDVDTNATPGHTVTYLLSGPDATRFNISSTGQITFVASPDYEAPNDVGLDHTYEITVTATADFAPTQSDSQDLTITVTPVNDNTPIFADPAPDFSLPENSPVGTVVGTVSATDADLPPQSLTYSIVSGNASGAFTINPTTGEITVANATPLDFETTSLFTLTVRVTDNGSPTANTADATVDITLTPVNDNTPIFANLAPDFSLPENSAVGTVVGTVSATDADVPAQSLTYSIVSGNGSGAFTINPTTGEITVANSTPLDLETTSSFTLTVRVTDNGTPTARTADATVDINLTPVNDNTPIFADPAPDFSLPENSAVGTVVGAVSATDADLPTESLTYSIISGNASGAFAINPTTGQITVANATPLDFETTMSFTLTVRVTDNGTPTARTADATVDITLTPVNDITPIFADPAPDFSLPENSAVGTVVGTVSATDADLPAQSLTYSIVSGNGSGAFTINPTTGEITVANATPLDLETTPSFTLTVRVTDNGSPTARTADATVDITLTPVNDNTPIFANPAPDFSLPENSAVGTVVGTVSATDADQPTQSLTYSIVSGNASGAFTINPTTGQITVANTTPLDFESTTSFTLTVRVTDNGTPTALTADATVDITLTPVNDNTPVFTGPAPDFSLPENSAIGTVVGTVTATDADLPAQSLTYSIISGNGSGVFAINATTGEITVANATPLDFETTTSFALTVRVTDNGSPTPRFADAAVGISLTPVNDNTPVYANPAPDFSLPENSTVGTVVGTVSATDADVPAQSLTYSIVSGNGSGAFTINPTTGEITVAKATPLDFETTTLFTLTVRVTDNGTPTARTADATVDITLTPVNDNTPVFADPAPDFSLHENSPAGTVVGTVPATDADLPAQSLTYSIISGNGSGAFAINPTTGQITVANATPLNFETTTSFTLTVHVTDNGSPLARVADATVDITLTPLNDNTPVFANPTPSFSLPENSTVGTVVGSVVATDADLPAQSLTYSIVSGNASGAFTINPTTGEITVANATPLDRETTAAFTLTVRVTDNGSPTARTADATVGITLTAVNDNTPIFGNPAPDFSLPENSAIGTVVGTVAATDADLPAQSLTYSIISGNASGAFTINPTTGQITVANTTPLDLETTTTFTLTVHVTDNGTPTARTADATVDITLTPVNDNTPVFVNASPTFTIAENLSAGTVVGTVSATDADLPAQSLTYSIVSGNASGAFAINPTTGQITVADPTAIDFEDTTTFTLTVRVTDNGSPTARTADAMVEIDVTNVEEGPTITLPPAGTILAGRTPQAIAPAGSFDYDDVAAPNFDGATLTVSIAAGRAKKDRLSLLKNGDGIGKIVVKGHKIFANNLLIGTFKGGKSNAHPNLVVTLNGSATKTSVEHLIQRVALRATHDVGTTRTINLQVTNIGGVDSNVASTNITVNS